MHIHVYKHSFFIYNCIFCVTEAMNRIRHNLMSYFWNMPDITNMNIPEGANTTSTTKVSVQ